MKKKLTTIFGALFLCTFSVTSCSSSIESDATKLAEMQCQTFKMIEKMGEGKVDLNENAVFAAKMDLFTKEMKEKYSSPEENKKFEEACLKAVAAGCE